MTSYERKEEYIVHVVTVILLILGLCAIYSCTDPAPVGKDPARLTPIDGKCKQDLTEESNWDTIEGFGAGARTQHGTRELFSPIEDAHDEHLQMIKEQWNR
jgi:hypothetical protein